MRLFLLSALALGACQAGQAKAGTYEEAVRCVELSVFPGTAVDFVRDEAKKRGVTVETNNMLKRWVIEAFRIGGELGMTEEEMGKELGDARLEAMTVLRDTPMNSRPSPEEYRAEVTKRFDDFYACAESAKSFPLPKGSKL